MVCRRSWSLNGERRGPVEESTELGRADARTGRVTGSFSGESTAAPVSFWTRSRKVVASAWTKVVEVGGGVGGEETV